jgi:hypothetical protein
MAKQILEKDQWGRNVVYLAEYKTTTYSNKCIFSNLDSAIFFVVTGLGGDVNWSTFPKIDEKEKYPYEERDGNNPSRDPIFIVKRPSLHNSDIEIKGSVTKTAAMSEWTVGNGIAVAAKKFFAEATGRDVVVLAGEGDRLHGTVTKEKL